MIRVGLVGEDPNDTSSIKNLLDKKYSGKVQFHPLVRGIKGYHLDIPKIKKSLPIEFKDKKCQFVVYIRDLDGLESETRKLNIRKKWFNDLDSLVNNKGILLLNIWELEALILGDIETFKSVYNVKFNFKSNPCFQKDPKELLMRATSHSNKKYEESHCPELFKKLDIDKIEEKCKCFKDFIEIFDKKIA